MSSAIFFPFTVYLLGENCLPLSIYFAPRHPLKPIPPLIYIQLNLSKQKRIHLYVRRLIYVWVTHRPVEPRESAFHICHKYVRSTGKRLM